MKASEFKEHRIKQGLTQAQLAEKLGVSERTLQRYEAGRQDIPKPVAYFLSYLCLMASNA